MDHAETVANGAGVEVVARDEPGAPGRDTDRRRFLEWVGEWPERFSLEIHALVLMDNYDHLVVRTQEPRVKGTTRGLEPGRSDGWGGPARGHAAD